MNKGKSGQYSVVGRSSAAVMRAVLTALLAMTLPVVSHASEDPLVGMNRAVHGFNKALDTAVLKPAAQTYASVTPTFLRQRVSSFFYNIDDVRVTINDLLQFKFSQAAADAGRLALNTTVGLGGMFDVANPMFGWEKHHEDFGQTLGYWAVNSGPYVELPFLGPSTARDSAGQVVDVLLNPLQLFYSPGQHSAFTAGEGVHDRAALLNFEGLITGDEYVFLREAYLQRREFLVKDGEVEDAFGDFDADFDELAFDMPIASAGDK